MLGQLVHDWRRFMIGRLLVFEWALAIMLAVLWGCLSTSLTTAFKGPGGVDELWAAAPYDFMGTFIVPLLLVVNTGIRFGGDYTQGIEKYELLSRRTRGQVLAAHLLFLVSSSLVIYLCTCAGFLLTPLLTGRLADASLAGVFDLVMGFLTVWAGSWPMLALLVLGGVVLRSLEGIVGAGLGLLVIVNVLNSFAGSAAWLIPVIFMLRPVSAIGDDHLVGAFVVALVVTTASILAALAIWNRKDVLR